MSKGKNLKNSLATYMLNFSASGNVDGTSKKRTIFNENRYIFC